MTSLAIPYPRVRTLEPPHINWKKVLLVVLFAAVLYCAHAIVRHGVEAEAVRKCLEDKPPVAHLFNPATGRHYFVCQMEDEEGNPVFGVQVRIKVGMQWKEITSVIKNKMHKLDQVIKYIENCGAGMCK